MLISVVIPTYNGDSLLQKSLPKLRDALSQLENYEVIIVDNGSSDSTDSVVNFLLPVVSQYIKLNHNYGFTKAVNIGAKKAKGEYILILNNDCFVEEDTLINLLNYLKKNKQYVATQPVIDELRITNDQLGSIGYEVDLKKGKANMITNYELAMSNDNIWKTGKVYGLSATCLLIRREIFNKIGGFDELFHSYLEDVDLFIRLAENGYKYSPCLDARASHMHMQTSSKMGTYKQSHDLINWIKIILKNYPMKFIIKNAISLFTERLRNLNGLFKVIFNY